MIRILVLTVAMLLLGVGAFPEPEAELLNETVLKESSLADLEKMLSTSDKRSESSMPELSSRLAWVLRGQMLPPEARKRTLLRANSTKADMVGGIPYVRQDVGPTKRALSMAIIGLDDELRAKAKPPEQ